jgi:peptidoglycan/xylan/chitin deacetylase (PgdA/CDA1 family)
MSFGLPASAWHRSGLARYLRGDGTLRLPPGFAGGDAGLAEAVRLHAAFPGGRPLSARLPVSYVRVPPWVRDLVAAGIGRWKRYSVGHWASFPQWPLDLSADFVADAMRGGPPLGAGRPTPVLLTHDLDSAEGLANLVDHFLDLEEAVGARSTSYVVPCAWPLDRGRLDEAARRGHAVGIHGYDHSNRTAFAGPEERRRRLDAARPLIERYGPTGYRAPSLLRTPELLHDLARLYAYDSSIPTSGGLFPVPNNGCATARPFRVEGIAEIPLSLPRDGSLRFLGHSPRQIANLWINTADTIARSGGVVVLLTHCERRFSGNAAMRDAYRRFLEHVASAPRFCWGTPSDVLTRVRPVPSAA